MHGLDPELQQLVDAGRGYDDPAAADRARVTRALVARLGAGALAAATTTATGAVASATTATTTAGAASTPAVATLGGTVVKIVGVVALAGTLGLAGAAVVRSRLAPERRSPAVTRSTAEARSSSTPPSPAPGPEVALEAEVRLLGDAQQALRDGRRSRALELVDEHAHRFPDGLLRQEGLAVRVLALCGLGRTGPARQEAEHFLQAWPHSPFATQIRASCLQSPR